MASVPLYIAECVRLREVISCTCMCMYVRVCACRF